MKRILFLFGLLVFVLSACSFFSPSEESIQAAIEQTQAAAPTATPTAEPTVEPTVEPTAEPDPTEVQEVEVESLIAQPEAEIISVAAMFTEANVYSMSFPQDDVFLVTIEVPGGVADDYYALVDRKQYECEVLEQYPDRLYCSGLAPETNKLVMVQIVSIESDEVVFEAEIGVPAVANISNAGSGSNGSDDGKSTKQPPAPQPTQGPPPPDGPPPPAPPPDPGP